MRDKRRKSEVRPQHSSISVREIVELTMRRGPLYSPLWNTPAESLRLNAETELRGRLENIAAEKAVKIIQRPADELLAPEAKTPFLSFKLALAMELDCPELESKVRLWTQVDALWRRADALTSLISFKTYSAPLSNLGEEALSAHWAEAKLNAYLLAEIYAWPADAKLQIELHYQSPDFSSEFKTFSRIYSKAALDDFFQQVFSNYRKHFKPLNPFSDSIIDKLKNIKFPYRSFRKGQKEMMTEVLSLIVHNSLGLIQAPTGLGKTLASLYPALRALVYGHCDAVFYATAMTSTRSVVESEIEDLRQTSRKAGEEIFLRSLRLDTKWNFCLDKSYFCDQRRCPYARNYYDNLDAALSELASVQALEIEKIKAVGQKYKLCPHQLALDIAMYCHIVIGDYNHVFSPNARLKNFLNPEERKVALLIDEAHNLPSRAREIFSARLSQDELLKARTAISESQFKEFKRKEELLQELDRLNELFLELLKYSNANSASEFPQSFFKDNPLRDDTDSSLWAATKGFIALRAKPSKVQSLIEDNLRVLRELIDIESGFNSTHPIFNLFFKLLNLDSTLSQEYADNYLSTFSITPDSKSEFSLLCLDAREQLSRYYNNLHPAIFFSATLSPLYYYRELLSKESSEAEEVAYSNPFIEDNLELLILTQYSMKTADRSENFSSIMEFILDLVSEKPINCLVYVPSWFYLEQVKEYFSDQKLAGNLRLSFQKPAMNYQEKEAFIAQFSDFGQKSLLAFAVLASNFNEGIDLKGEKLSAVVVLSTAHPALSPERQLLAEYVDKKYSGNGENYTYLCPGFNRVQQAVGRLIRDPNDRGLAVLIDSRWSEPKYQKLFPEEWQPIYCKNSAEVLARARAFWSQADSRRRIK